MRKFLTQLILYTVLTVFIPRMANAQWIQTNGPYCEPIKCLAVIGNTILAGSDSGGVFLSNDNGTSWNEADSGLPNSDVISLAVSGSIIFAGVGTGNGIYLSTDNGASWKEANSGLPNTSVHSLAVCDGNIFAGTSQIGIYRSTNKGASWNAVNTGLDPILFYVDAIAANSNTIFASTNFSSSVGLPDVNSRGLFRSTDNGTNWLELDTNVAYDFVNSLAVNGSNVFAGTQRGVFLSTDNGTSWNRANVGLTNTFVYSLAVNGNTIFAGTDSGGVFYSMNNGANWNAFDSGLPKANIHSFAVCGSTIFASTYRRGLWRRPLSEMVGLIDQKTDRVTIQQAHLKIGPQSRTGTTVAMEFTVPHSDQVAITTYDLAGRETSTLINQQLNAGSHQFLWDTHTYTEGCYLVRMQTGAMSCAKLVWIRR